MNGGLRNIGYFQITSDASKSLQNVFVMKDDETKEDYGIPTCRFGQFLRDLFSMGVEEVEKRNSLALMSLDLTRTLFHTLAFQVRAFHIGSKTTIENRGVTISTRFEKQVPTYGTCDLTVIEEYITTALCKHILGWLKGMNSYTVVIVANPEMNIFRIHFPEMVLSHYMYSEICSNIPVYSTVLPSSASSSSVAAKATTTAAEDVSSVSAAVETLVGDYAVVVGGQEQKPESNERGNEEKQQNREISLLVSNGHYMSILAAPDLAASDSEHSLTPIGIYLMSDDLIIHRIRIQTFDEDLKLVSRTFRPSTSEYTTHFYELMKLVTELFGSSQLRVTGSLFGNIGTSRNIANDAVGMMMRLCSSPIAISYRTEREYPNFLLEKS